MSPEAEASSIAASPLSYTLEDGREFTANSRVEAIAQCPFLSKLPVDQAGAFLDLLEIPAPDQPETTVVEPTPKQQIVKQASENRETAAVKQTIIPDKHPEIPETELPRTKSLLKPLDIVPEAAMESVQEPSRAEVFTSPTELIPEMHPEHIMQVQQEMMGDAQQTAAPLTAPMETTPAYDSEPTELSVPQITSEVPKERELAPDEPNITLEQLLPPEHKEELSVFAQYEEDASPGQGLAIEGIQPEFLSEDNVDSIEDNTLVPDELPSLAPTESLHEHGKEDLASFASELVELLGTPSVEAGSILPEPTGHEQDSEPKSGLLAPYLPKLHERILNNEPVPAAITEAIARLQEVAASNDPAQQELTEEILTDLITVLTSLGCAEPQQILRDFARNHDIQELFVQLRRELPDLTKLIDYQQHLLQALHKSLTASDRRITISRLLWELLYKSVFARPAYLLY